MMLDKQEVRMLWERDQKLYGNPDGPTFEFLIRKANELGFTGDQVYEWIVKGSQKTNREFNKKFE